MTKESEEKKKLRLSVSAIKTYESCKRKYYYQYIEKLPRKSDWEHLKVGNFVHEVLELFHEKLKQSSASVDDWKIIITDLCKEKQKKFSLDVEQADVAKTMLKKYLALLEEEGLPQVVATEKKFSITIEDDIIMVGVIDRVDATGTDQFHLVDYKGLAIDTPIPTPTGWTTMADLKVGDQVLGSSGKPTTVTLKSGIHNRPCYKITLSDHSSVVCDNVHLWNVGYRASRYNANYDATINTEELYNRFLRKNELKGSGLFVIENNNLTKLPPALGHIEAAYLNKYRTITNIEPVESVPTQCIAVDAEDSLFLCGRGMIVTHNTGKSKYLDEVQLLVYALSMFREFPHLETFKASYLCLAENCKFISYNFSKTDALKVEQKIKKIASDIKTDQTWVASPSPLCAYCDFTKVCTAIPDKFRPKDELISIGNARKEWA